MQYIIVCIGDLGNPFKEALNRIQLYRYFSENNGQLLNSPSLSMRTRSELPTLQEEKQPCEHKNAEKLVPIGFGVIQLDLEVAEGGWQIFSLKELSEMEREAKICTIKD